MNRLKKILLIILLIILGLIALVFVIRTINGFRYPSNESVFSFYPHSQIDKYDRNVSGVTVTKLQNGKVSGLHLKPAGTANKGTIVTFGGSEGGLLYGPSLQLAKNGYEVLDLYYFNAPNMPELLHKVPLDFYQEVKDYCKENCSSSPKTIVGYSKGTELAQLLASKYDGIENLVLYSPSAYVFQGFDQSNPASSWTFKGQELPYISTHGADPNELGAMFGNMLINTPVTYRSLYESALKNATNKNEARIPLAGSIKNILMFAGEKDGLWPSKSMGETIKSSAGDRAEIHVYENAGHTFAGPGYNTASATRTGGTQSANDAAKSDSDKILLQKLSQWYTANN